MHFQAVWREEEAAETFFQDTLNSIHLLNQCLWISGGGHQINHMWTDAQDSYILYVHEWLYKIGDLIRSFFYLMVIKFLPILRLMDVISVSLPDIKITYSSTWNDKKIRIEPSITTHVQSIMSLRELELNAAKRLNPVD